MLHELTDPFGIRRAIRDSSFSDIQDSSVWTSILSTFRYTAPCSLTALLPAEASAIARQAYLAAMLTFHTLGDEGMNLRTDLSRALNDRLELRREAGINTETMGPALRMFSEGRIVPFPIDLFREGMARAAADTSSVSPPLDPEAVLDTPR